MSKAKFTKGEWYVPEVDSSTPLQVVSLGCKRHIVTFEDEPLEHDKEDLANAHLTAAAPEMYGALTDLMLNNEYNLPMKGVRKIENLLAKARGES